MSNESVFGQKRIGSVPGLPVRATIVSYSPNSGIVSVQLQSGKIVPVKIPVSWMGPQGQISCGYPERGTSLFVVQIQGNEWVFSGYDQPDSRGGYDGDGTRRVSNAAKISPGRWLTLVSDNVQIIADSRDGITQGSSINFTQADPQRGIFSSRFSQELHFTESHREVIGPIFRDLDSNSSRGVSGSSLSGHSYNDSLRQVGLDPSSKPASLGTNRNPALAENRAMYYEFINSFGYTNDEEEERIYSGQDETGIKPYQRKKSRTDTMSLSLDQPNFLAEIIIGTVVDIFGNILDINRNILPSGLIDSLSFRKSEEDQDIVFRKLREQLRKSIAYHFEINARKENIDESVNSGRDFPGIFTPSYPQKSSDVKDYSRDRSRFFVDIDKEGQFKMNVPASSDVGNIPLLVRNENFSNLKGAEAEKDRGQFLRNITSNTDVFLEPHGKGVVSLKSNEETLKSFAAPLNRLKSDTEQRIKLGTGFHDISNVLYLHKFEKPYSNTGNAGYNESLLNAVTPVGDIVSKEIIVSGEGANAGGRSGTISMDGMLSLSVGANTVDRQSLWLDCAGGIVTSIGRDRFQRSVSATLDGDLFMQVGGPGISDDSRFPSVQFNNETRDGVVDIRIWNSGSFHTIRIDNQGIKIHTPQRIDIVSEGEMRFKSVRANMYFDAESIFFYGKDASHNRMVLRSSEGAAGRTI